jgi:hypothetical protein
MSERPTRWTFYFYYLSQLYCPLHVSNKQTHYQEVTSLHATHSVFHARIWCLVTNTLRLELYIPIPIPLACAECDDSLPFSGASSIPLCYILFVFLFICKYRTKNSQYKGQNKKKRSKCHIDVCPVQVLPLPAHHHLPLHQLYNNYCICLFVDLLSNVFTNANDGITSTPGLCLYVIYVYCIYTTILQLHFSEPKYFPLLHLCT